MDEGQKQNYLEKYRLAKASGFKFYPDIIYKDVLISFALFVLMVGLAIYVGVPEEPPADPSDSAYIPRPEWYFLFFFQLLKYFPGQLEWVGTTIVPGVAVLALLLIPLYDRSPFRHWRKRKAAVLLMGTILAGIVALTVIAAVTTPTQAEIALSSSLSDKIVVGADLYAIQCVECHGVEGEGGEIKGVEGLEGVVVKPINSQDELYTRTDETLFNILDYGQPDLGMPPFGKAYGGELARSDLDTIVMFIRYSWDDRAELPTEAAQASTIPSLAPDEVPSYVVHLEPVIKRNCLSCHRPGKKNNNYLMRTYEEILATGDHTPNIVVGDLNSNTVLMLYRQEIEAGGPMPPTRALKPELIEIFERWIIAGMPETAEQAAKLSASSPAEAAENFTPASHRR